MDNFEDIRKQTPKDIQIFVEKSFDIADEVDFILEKQGKNRAFLALSLDKNESEISKWLSGLHNLTIKSISKIEATLGETVISTPTQEMKKYEGVFKTLEKKIKSLQDKIEKLDVENRRLKKMISHNTYSDQMDDYMDDTSSKYLFLFSEAPLKAEEREMTYLGRQTTIQIGESTPEWTKKTDYTKASLIKDEYEKIST